MTDTIMQLYYGEINPSAQFRAQFSKHKQIRQSCYARHESFIARLSAIDPNLRKEMEQLLDEQLEADFLDLPEAFYEGFRLGSMLMLELLY